MNYTYFGFFIMGVCILTLIKFQAYSLLLVSFLLIGFYVIVAKSGKFPRLEKFIDDAF